jgi:hypothetical protein
VGVGTAAVQFADAAVLANDGQGTNILTSATPTTLTLGSSAPEATTPVVTSQPGVPGAPYITSSTHPDPTKWYSAQNVSLSWKNPDDSTAIMVQYDKNPVGEPEKIYTPPISDKTLSLTDGSWYFHAQEKNAQGWGAIAHFRIQVDTTAPESFTVDVSGMR